MNRKNLTLRVKTRVSRIIVENGKAMGVEIFHGNGNKSIVEATSEIIVSSGAINSPRLLMLSGIGPANELKANGIDPKVDLPGVGRNLQDHICTNVHVATKTHMSYDGHDKFPWSIPHGIQWLLYGTGPAAAVIVEGGGFFKGEDQQRPDLQIHVAPATVVRGGQTKIPGFGFTVNSTFLRPRSRGTIKLKSSNPLDQPLVDPNYLDDPHDRKMALKSVRIIRDVLSQSAIAPLIDIERLPGPEVQTDEEIMAYVRQYGCCDYHPVGTCKMGVDEEAVVDPQLRVRGVERLRVIDSSIMPVLISGNTNAPSMMIGEKGADLIRGLMAAK